MPTAKQNFPILLKWRGVMLYVMLFVTFCSDASFGDDNKPSTASSLPREIVLAQWQDAKADLHTAQSDLQSLQSARSRIAASEAARREMKLPSQVALDIQALITQFQALKSLPADTDLLQDPNETGNHFLEAYTKVMQHNFMEVNPPTPDFGGSTDAVVTTILRSVSYPNVFPPTINNPALQQLIAAVGTFGYWGGGAPTQPEGKKTRASIEALIKRAEPELSNIQPTWEKYTSDLSAGLEKFYKNLLKALDDAIEAKVKDVDVKRVAMAGFETSLAHLESTANQAEQSKADLSKSLSTAVYWMIAAIILLFAILWAFPKDLASEVIRERTMIELLSMGFLLLTIIILGTGGRLNAEALGALLGTVSGYIFGRKAGEAGAQSEVLRKLTTPSIPSPPPAPVWNKPNLSLLQMPSDASVLAAYAQPIGGGAAISLGQTHSNTLTVTGLTPGAQYVVWFVSSNQAGQSGNGAQITITA